MMPRFFKDMPKNKPGIWIACVIRTTLFNRNEVWNRKYNGLRRAYIMARLMALLEDICTPHHNGELGIDWGVKRDH